MTVVELAGRIAELVQQHWQEHEAPLLLSRLGNADRGEVGRLARELSGNLAEFVRAHVADRLRIVGGSDNPTVMAAIPKDIHGSIGVDELLVRARERGTTGPPRYHPAFWAAFRVPLNDAERRYVSTRAPIRFRDSASDEPGAPGFVEIERQYVADAEADAPRVHDLIKGWCDANELDLRSFLSNKRPSLDLPSNDLLGHLIVALEPGDLRRMSIPLDVVSKLRRQSL